MGGSGGWVGRVHPEGGGVNKRNPMALVVVSCMRYKGMQRTIVFIYIYIYIFNMNIKIYVKNLFLKFLIYDGLK